MISEFEFNCPTVEVRVTVTRQTLTFQLWVVAPRRA